MKTFAVIATVCIASANAASTLNRMRTNPGHKSVARRLNNGNEEYDPFMGISERELESSMSMVMVDDPEASEVETMASSGAIAGASVSALAVAGAMMLL